MTTVQVLYVSNLHAVILSNSVTKKYRMFEKHFESLTV